MTFCIHCGKQIQDNMRFCKYCGTEVKAAPQPAAVYVDSGEEETVFMDAKPMQRVVYQEPPNEEVYPVVAVFDEPREKKRIGLWVVLILLLLALAGAAFYLIYNDNYKQVLSAIGLQQASQPETVAAWIEPSTTAPPQAVQPTESPLEFSFPKEETLPPIITTAAETLPGGSGMVTISPTLYRVDTKSPIDHTPLRIRGGPSVEFEKIGSIPDLQVVIVTQMMDDWAYVTFEGVSGWAYMGWMVPVN